MRKRGGSGLKPLQSTPSLSYAYKYGNSAMSNSHGFLAHHANKQNVLNSMSGGSGNPPLSPSEVNAGGTPVVVPQFHEALPAGPANANSASVKNNKVNLTTIQNKKYDHYAFMGGSTRRRRINKNKRRKNKSKRNKSKRNRTKNRFLRKKTERRRGKKERKERK